jgi:RNA polymerase sigma factor (sigma-70 family)
MHLDWESVYEDQMPKVYNYFLYSVRDRSVAEDLTSKTFEKAWRGRRRYRRNIAKFSTWLFTIARNVKKDYLRQQHVNSSIENVDHPSGENSIEETVQYRADIEHHSELMKTLPYRDQELLARDIVKCCGSTTLGGDPYGILLDK